MAKVVKGTTNQTIPLINKERNTIIRSNTIISISKHLQTWAATPIMMRLTLSKLIGAFKLVLCE